MKISLNEVEKNSCCSNKIFKEHERKNAIISEIQPIELMNMEIKRYFSVEELRSSNVYKTNLGNKKP